MKCKIIRLKNVLVSEKYANQCLERALSLDLPAELFDGVNGLEYERHLEILNIKPNKHAFDMKKNKKGVYGCALSHYYLWLACVRDNVPYLILEHDGYMIHRLPHNILNAFDDVLALDRHDPYSPIYEDLLALDNRLDYQIYPHFNHLYKPWKSNELYKSGNHLRGAYAYIIKPQGATKLIEWIAVNGFLPADHQIGNMIVDIKMVQPSLARLHPDYIGRIKEMSLTNDLEAGLADQSSSQQE